MRSSPTFALFAAASAALHVGVAAAILHARAPLPARDPAPALAGNTFEIGDLGDLGATGDRSANPPASEDEREIDLDQGVPAAAGAAAPKALDRAARTRDASERARARRRSKPEASGAPPAADPGSPSADLYGAVGERAAVDLATAFTRGFPQAASADPVWATVPFGAAGDATVLLTIDESGHLVQEAIAGSAPAALRAGIARTLALLRARAFTARGATTRLTVSAHVAPDQVHDGLHGDVFALGGSFTGGQGNAFFALNIGRRVDITIRATHAR